MRQNLLFVVGVVALLGAGAVATMQDPPRPAPVDWVTVEFKASDCDTDGYDVSWRTDYSSGVGGYVVTGVQLSGVTWFCLKQDITVYLNSRSTEASGGSVLAWAVVPGDPAVTSSEYERRVFFDFSDAHVAARSINGIAVEIPDRADSDVFAQIRDFYSGAPVTAIAYGDAIRVAARAERGASDGTGVIVDPEGVVFFWYCFSSETAPAVCRDGSAGSIALGNAVDGVPLAGGTPNDAMATADSATFTPLEAGYYVFRVRFATADYTYYGSEDSGGTEMRLLVRKADRAPGLTLNRTTATWGDVIRLSSSIALPYGPEAPQGTVTFYEGSTTLGSCELTAGSACDLTTNTIGAGSRSLTAVYAGNANYAAATSPLRQLTIAKTRSTTTSTPSATSIAFGSRIGLYARVDLSTGAAAPSGTVTFRNGTTTVGTCVLAPRVGAGLSSDCSTGTTALPVGATNSLTAIYGGSVNILGSTSAATVVAVTNTSETTTGITAGNASPRYGEPVVLTMRVSRVGGGATPTGTVALADGGSALGSCTLVSVTTGVAGCTYTTTAALEAGAHTIRATYTSATFGSSFGETVVTVLAADTVTTVTATTTSPAAGQTVTYSARTAIVAPGRGTPTGSLAFYVDGGASPVKSCAPGLTCSYSTGDFTSGSHTVSAVFTPADAARFNASTGSVGIAVARALTTSTWNADPSTGVYGQLFTISGTVTVSSPGTGNPLGRLDFSEGTNWRGSCELTSGSAVGTSRATCSIGWRPDAGTRSLSVYYRPSAGAAYGASGSTKSLLVTKLGTTTAIYNQTSLAIPRGGYVTWVAIVASTYGRPAGTVAFRHGTTTVGNATLVTPDAQTWCSDFLASKGANASTSACARFTYRYAYAGTYSVGAAYAGSTNYATSTSGRITLVVP